MTMEEVLKAALKVETKENLLSGDIWLTIENEQYPNGVFLQFEAKELLNGNISGDNFSVYGYENKLVNGEIETDYSNTIINFKFNKLELLILKDFDKSLNMAGIDADIMHSKYFNEIIGINLTEDKNVIDNCYFIGTFKDKFATYLRVDSGAITEIKVFNTFEEAQKDFDATNFYNKSSTYKEDSEKLNKLVKEYKLQTALEQIRDEMSQTQENNQDIFQNFYQKIVGKRDAFAITQSIEDFDNKQENIRRNR